MPAKSQRALDIEAFLKTAEPVKELFERVQLGADVKVLPVYKVPINMLAYNIRNGRISSELLAKEESLGRKLDPLLDADRKEVRKILLEQEPREAELLRADLKEHGQTHPGIITFDGIVINANRRMAVLSALHDEFSVPKYEYLAVAVLPPNVGDVDLWRIEAGLQFAKDFRLAYSAVNELLKLREGMQCGMDAKKIEAALMGRYTDKEVEERIEVLDLIDNYLESIGSPQQYGLVAGNVEKFNSLRNNVVSTVKRKELLDADDLAALIETAYAMIKHTDLTHWNIRELAKIIANPRAFDELKGSIDWAEPLNTAPAALKDAFVSASEIVEATNESGQPERLIRRALNALDRVDTKSPQLNEPKIQEMITRLKSIVDKLPVQ
jgi:hypothetical protein